jgi:type I restriction enzyme M protein
MLDTATKRRIDDCRDILVGKLPDPKAQIEQITIGLIYKFMDDMDKEAMELGGSAKYFSCDYEKYAWDKLFDTKVTATEMLNLYSEAIESMEKNPNIPQLFRDIFKNAYLPYRSAETLKLFLKTIGEFEYSHSEKLGDAFEYLLSVMGSQGDAGQFRTPRHIIDFLVAIIDPDKGETILDPACGTAGFLISAYKHILLKNTKANQNSSSYSLRTLHATSQQATAQQTTAPSYQRYNIFTYNQLDEKPFNNLGDQLTPDDRKKLIQNFAGYDISPDMVRLSLVNLYLHGFSDPHVNEYDTLSSEDRWNENFDVILANPPFMSPKGGIRPHKKFTINSNRSEVLFVDYIAEHLNPKGKAGIIVPEGVIFQSGKAYKDLRKMLVEHYLYAVVSLPAGVFNPYSGVKTSILLMDKAVAKQRNEILFVKIDNDGYNLGAQRTAVKGSQLEEAIKIIHDFGAGDSVSNSNSAPNSVRTLHATSPLKESSIAHLVPKAEIAANGDYNLSGERYKANLAVNSKFELVELSNEEIFTIVSGGTPSSSIDSYWNGNINWATLVDLPQSEFISTIKSTERKISEEGLKNSSAKLLPINSIIVSTRATIGRIAINEVECSTNQGFKNIIINDLNKAKTYFVALMMTNLIDKMNSMATGGTFKELSTSNFKTLQIPLPPLSIQEEIVAEIEGYQKIIDGAKAVVANYKPKIDIDPDWEMVELGDAFNKITTSVIPAELEESVVNYVGLDNISQGSGELIGEIVSNPKEIKSTKTVFKTNHILYGKLRPNLNKVYFSEIEGICSTDIFVLEATDEIEPKFYAYHFLSKQFNDDVMKGIKGAQLPRVGYEYFSKLIVPKPDIETQRQVVAQIEKEQALVNANKQLIEIFEQKIKDRIAKVWGVDKSEETLSMAAEPVGEYEKA